MRVIETILHCAVRRKIYEAVSAEVTRTAGPSALDCLELSTLSKRHTGTRTGDR